MARGGQGWARRTPAARSPARSATADGGYDVSHGTQVTAFRDGTARIVWTAETPVKDLRSDLARLAALPS